MFLIGFGVVVLIVVSVKEKQVFAGCRIFRRLDRSAAGIADGPRRKRFAFIGVVQRGVFSRGGKQRAAGDVFIDIFPGGVNFQL